MKKLTGILVALIIPLFLNAQIGAKGQQNKIQGTWTSNESGIEMILVLNADGTGTLDGDGFKYTALTGKLNLTGIGESETITYNYILQSNSLTVSGGDLDEKIIFNLSETSSGRAATNPTAPESTSNSIVGIWSGNNETIEFTKAGKCVYQGQVYSYQATNGNVTLQTSQGNLTMGYTVSGNQLSLIVNGQTLNYSKNGAPVTGVTATSATSSTTTAGGKQVAQELVGKWCYVNVNSTNSGGSSTEQCITLKADGTYEYYSESSRSVNTNAYSGGTNSQNSDRGTWSYDGTRVYYSSSMGAGSGSYLLEKRNHPKNNDPMIVLDGQTYVTQYQKAPWR